jgi:hypothetical protein
MIILYGAPLGFHKWATLKMKTTEKLLTGIKDQETNICIVTKPQRVKDPQINKKIVLFFKK